jgi:hypothetical protein
LNPHLQPGKSTLIGKNLNRGYQKKKKEEKIGMAEKNFQNFRGKNQEILQRKSKCEAKMKTIFLNNGRGMIS